MQNGSKKYLCYKLVLNELEDLVHGECPAHSLGHTRIQHTAFLPPFKSTPGSLRRGRGEEADSLLSSKWEGRQDERVPHFTLQNTVFSSKNKKNSLIVISQIKSQGSQRV